MEKPKSNFVKFKELIQDMVVGESFNHKYLLLKTNYEKCAHDNTAIDNIRNMACGAGYLVKTGRGFYTVVKQFTPDRFTDLQKEYRTRWHDLNLTKVQPRLHDMDDIEVKFDNGSIIPYSYSPWPFAIVTHWRINR